MLTHFYNFVFFTEPAVDVWYKRWVRDRFHYSDNLFCVAARIVNRLRSESNRNPSLYEHRDYSSFHVRRGDLQYAKVKISAEQILNASSEHLRIRELLYIATDERKKQEFFAPFYRWSDQHS